MSVCLVTGACGFMGSHMVEVLTQAGHRVRATDLAQNYHHDDPEEGRFPSVLKEHHVEFIPADTADPATLSKIMEGVEYVFHVAAVYSHQASWEKLYQANVEGTFHLLELLKKTPSFKKIILWGAGGIYRFPKSAEDLPLTEASPIEPQSPYLLSKWEQEVLVEKFCKKNGLKFSVVRPTTMYGPRVLYGGGQMIYDALDVETISVPRNFTFRIPTVHVHDVCRAALFLAEKSETDGEAYNVVDDSHVMTAEFFHLMAQLTGKPFRVLPPVPLSITKINLKLMNFLSRWRYEILGGLPPKFENDTLEYFGIDFVYSNEKLKQAGFTFQYGDFALGLREALPWYHKHFGL